jgi:hypothetical protein
MDGYQIGMGSLKTGKSLSDYIGRIVDQLLHVALL